MRARLTLFQPSSRRGYAAPIGDITERPAAGEAGVDGDSWYAHILGGGPDVNPELTGSQKFDVYDEMAKTDASIKALLMFWSLPSEGRRLGPEPEGRRTGCRSRTRSRSRSATRQRPVRDRAARRLWLDLSWKELLAQGLKELLTMGPCIEELVWDDVRSWVDADGDST
jgi:hypothetical protein